jgi:hypothetical protein
MFWYSLASSNENVGSILSDLPVLALIKWDVSPIQSFKSADERDCKVIDRLKGGH